ncbi:unnamed protein product, partial [Discosporangium mesarthrocarpum]
MVAGAGGVSNASPHQQSQQLVKRRRWYLGIQSKKEPAHVMTEVYRALLQLGCVWKVLSSYRIRCSWKPDGGNSALP